MSEIFKFHVAVERSGETRYGPAGDDAAPMNGDVAMADASAPAPELRPRRLVCNVINATLRDHESDFEGVRVVHDGMASLYAPRMLSWTTKVFPAIDPDSDLRKPSATGAGAAG